MKFKFSPKALKRSGPNYLVYPTPEAKEANQAAIGLLRKSGKGENTTWCVEIFTVDGRTREAGVVATREAGFKLAIETLRKTPSGRNLLRRAWQAATVLRV